MPSTYSPSLRLELIGSGEQSGVWGSTTNTNLGTLLEQSITGVQAITMTDGNYTLSNYNGVSDEARKAVLVVGGTNAAIRDIIAPLVMKTYIIKNNTSGGFAINIRASSGASAAIPNGGTATVYCDGVNFNLIIPYLATTATTATTAATVTNGVYTVGAQTISGTKTFSDVVLLGDAGFMFASDGSVDTGMSWASDGVFNVRCNGVTVGQFNSTGFTGTAATAGNASTSQFFTLTTTSDGVLGCNTTGYDSAYLFNGSTSWGVYSPTGGTAFSYTRATGAMTFFGSATLSLGTGQTWQNVSGSRAQATNYTNSTGKPIMVNIYTAVAGGSGTVTVGGAVAAYNAGSIYAYNVFSVIVPNGVTYSCSLLSAGFVWTELR